MFTDILQNRCTYKLHNLHKKTRLLESLFGKVVCLKAWNFIQKRLNHDYFLVNFAQFFKKNICKCFWITAPVDYSIPAKVLPIHHSCLFFLHFFPFIIDNCNYGSLFRKVIKMKIFLLFPIIYPKIIMNEGKTISPRQ